MKLSIIALGICASAVYADSSAAPSQEEIYEWDSCLSTLLNGFAAGRTGSSAGCTLWTCLENVATKYDRGGTLAVAGGVVNKACLVEPLLIGWVYVQQYSIMCDWAVSVRQQGFGPFVKGKI
ncbi:hypothetical protein N7454_010427 [Penicillium verhagenii]|nr:hypothetical protein N7454_010427 [Penicillium verhagenii]